MERLIRFFLHCLFQQVNIAVHLIFALHNCRLIPIMMDDHVRYMKCSFRVNPTDRRRNLLMNSTFKPMTRSIAEETQHRIHSSPLLTCTCIVMNV
ncbi:hypothetical protein D3C74_390320 [compost metagenome]